VVPSDDAEGIEIAAGAGVSAEDEPYDDSHRSGELDAEGSLNARIREALRADASTSPLADRLEIAMLGSTAVIRGPVDGIEDSDAIIEVASRVAGVADVRDETEIPGL
jgi:osmotically-inducible protein OsmY